MSNNFDLLILDTVLARPNLDIGTAVDRIHSSMTTDRAVMHVAETMDPADWAPVMEQIVTELSLRRHGVQFIMIFDAWYLPYRSLFSGFESRCEEIFFVDHNLVRTWWLLENKRVSGCSPCWRSDSDRFLFLTGKPNKSHRIRLLWKLCQAGLQQHMTWSFSVPTVEDFVQSRSYLPELSDSQYQDFVTRHQCILDLPGMAQNSSYTGIPYDPAVYHDSLFRVISETDFDRPFLQPRVSEKTYTTIFNRLPFVMANEHRSLDFLEQRGFDCFRAYMARPNYDDPDSADYLKWKNTDQALASLIKNDQFLTYYDQIRDPGWPVVPDAGMLSTYPEILHNWTWPIMGDVDLRLDAIVDNTKHCLDSFTQDSATVSSIVERNRQCFLDIGSQETAVMLDFVRRHALDCADLGDLVQLDSDMFKAATAKVSLHR